MADRPVVLLRAAGGGGLELFIEYPLGVAPGPVILSQAHKNTLLIEITGRHPIRDWVRLPAVALRNQGPPEDCYE
jgi:hypothetical protein